MSATRRRRRTRRPRLGVRTILVGVLVLLLAGAGVWLVAFSSVLAVRDIAEVPFGVPLARLDTDGISERVAGLPPVRTVKVSRSWPNTLHIKVVERTARFVAHHDNTWQLVDDSGVGYLEVDQAPDGLVVAENVPHQEWADTARVIRALPDTAAERAESVTTRGPDAIVIHLTEGVTVEWGSAERSADKALVLSSLMTAVPDAKVYNVSAPDHPATR